MDRRTRITVLVVGLLLGLAVLVPRLASARLPGNDLGYSPEQPIAFSHRLHAGEMQIDCLYCHSGAEKSRHAGIPAPTLCMNCHKFVSAPWIDVRAENKLADEEERKPNQILSPEIAKIRAAIDENKSVEWVRIHLLPDFAFFDHRPHVAAGVTCQKCHGPVETMERVRQESSLSMGWCVDCHRNGHETKGTLDCSACHY